MTACAACDHNGVGGDVYAELAALRVATNRWAACTDRVQAALARDLRAARPPSSAVVVLEDHDGVRSGLVSVLAAAFPGITIVPCAAIAEARVALHARPAVVVADYYLGSGETSRDLLATRDPAVRAVLYSGTVDLAELISVGEDTGAVVLEKPLTEAAWERLLAHVRRALEESGALRRASR
jgi:FixJ family two-component response regulator